jgi:hypothetical protein
MFIHVCIFIHLTVTLEVLDYSKPVNDDADYDGDYGEELDTGYKSIELAAQDGPCEGPVTPTNARAEMIDTTKPIITDMITDEAQRSFAAPCMSPPSVVPNVTHANLPMFANSAHAS